MGGELKPLAYISWFEYNMALKGYGATIGPKESHESHIDATKARGVPVYYGDDIEALRKELSECKAERDECSRLYTNSVSENDALRIALDVANKHYEAQLTTIRNETIEECAEIAERWGDVEIRDALCELKDADK